jgi:hypothetical protein
VQDIPNLNSLVNDDTISGASSMELIGELYIDSLLNKRPLGA